VVGRAAICVRSEFMSLRSKPLRLLALCHQRDALLLAARRVVGLAAIAYYLMNTVGSTDMPGRN
jgi:hypothetical protein